MLGPAPGEHGHAAQGREAAAAGEGSSPRAAPAAGLTLALGGGYWAQPTSRPRFGLTDSRTVGSSSVAPQDCGSSPGQGQHVPLPLLRRRKAGWLAASLMGRRVRDQSIRWISVTTRDPSEWINAEVEVAQGAKRPAHRGGASRVRNSRMRSEAQRHRAPLAPAAWFSAFPWCRAGPPGRVVAISRKPGTRPVRRRCGCGANPDRWSEAVAETRVSPRRAAETRADPPRGPRR